MTDATLPSPIASTSPIDEKRVALAEVFGADYADGFDDPVLFMTRTLMSPAVKQFYKREYPFVSRTLFTESVYRRRPLYNQGVLDEFTALVAKKLTDISAMLDLKSDQIRKTCEKHAVMVDVDYMNPRTVLVPVIAGHAKSYIAVLERLDVAYQLAGAANLNGIIDSNTRKQYELICRKSVRAFSAMLRNEIIKLRKESQRMRLVMNAPDHEVTQAEGAHDEAMKNFDQAVVDDVALDAGISVNPTEAAALISDMTATTAAQRAKKPKTATSEAPGETAVAV